MDVGWRIKVQAGMSYIFNQERMRITPEEFSLAPSSHSASSIFSSASWVRDGLLFSAQSTSTAMWVTGGYGQKARWAKYPFNSWLQVFFANSKNCRAGLYSRGRWGSHGVWAQMAWSIREGWIWGCTGGPQEEGRAAPLLGTGRLLREDRTWGSLTPGVRIMPCKYLLTCLGWNRMRTNRTRRDGISVN